MAGREGLGGSTIMFTIIALVGLALVWANWAELDNVTRGEGRIVSSVQNQMVQASEGGVILRRYVSENTVVAEGEVLFEIDPVDASSELNRLAQRLAGLDIKELRLRAEINGSEFSVTAELNARSPMVALTEQSLFAARRAELAGQLAVLEQRLQQRQQDLRAAENSLGTAERTAGFLEEEIAVVAPLVRDNIAPTTRLLELQRQREQALGERDRSSVGIEQARSSMVELETEIDNAKANYKLRAMDEINTVVAEQSELSESLPRLEERVSRTVIRAPDGGDRKPSELPHARRICEYRRCDAGAGADGRGTDH